MTGTSQWYLTILGLFSDRELFQLFFNWIKKFIIMFDDSHVWETL